MFINVPDDLGGHTLSGRSNNATDLRFSETVPQGVPSKLAHTAETRSSHRPSYTFHLLLEWALPSSSSVPLNDTTLALLVRKTILPYLCASFRGSLSLNGRSSEACFLFCYTYLHCHCSSPAFSGTFPGQTLQLSLSVSHPALSRRSHNCLRDDSSPDSSVRRGLPVPLLRYHVGDTIKWRPCFDSDSFAIVSTDIATVRLLIFIISLSDLPSSFTSGF